MSATNDPTYKSLENDSSNPTWLKRVPMVTGVLAGLAGFLTVRSANMSDQAIYHSTQAVLHQSRASDDWAEYQADSVKRHIDQIAADTANIDPAIKASLTAEARDMKDNRQKGMSVDARTEEAQRDQELKGGRQNLAIKDLLDYAGVAAQLGIALASVAALTRKKAAFTVGLVLGLLALIVTGYALAEPIVAQLMHRGG